MKTYDIYTVIVKGPDGQWGDWDGHGCFSEDAYQQGWEIADKGVPVAIRIDTYKRTKQPSKPVYTRLDQLNTAETIEVAA